jgi:hypothetical protein
MTPRFVRTAKSFFNPEMVFPFLLGATVLSVFGNAVTMVLTKWLGETVWVGLAIALGSVLVFAFSVWLLSRSLARIHPQVVTATQHRNPAKRRGLILLVSRPETCRAAITYHRPELEMCWLLCSTRSLDVARDLIQEFREIRFAEPIVVNDVNDPLEFRNRIDEVYSKLPRGWSESDVVGDYTGMTAHGSVGMALASLKPHRPLQYTPAQYDEQLRALAPLEPIEIELNWDLPDEQAPRPDVKAH